MKQAGKLRQILLGGLFLLSIFCLPSFSAGAQLKSQQAIQTELLLTKVQPVGRSLVYKNAFFLCKNLQHGEFEIFQFTQVLQSYHDLLTTRLKHLAIQRRHFNKPLAFIPARMTSQYSDEDSSLS